MSSAIEFPVEGISDGDLRLRLHADSDVPAIVAACQDPEIPRWTRVPEPYGETDARGWLEQETRGRSAGELLGLLVVDAAGDRLLGSVGIVHLDGDEGRCELGYWLVREARGHGVAARAVRMLSGWVFENLPVERIEIHAEPDNAPSRRVAERVGFRFEGVLRSYFVNKGVRRDAASYSLLRGELR
ncbi:MAG TPA: GNAT family N-acetyltransferase [Solirubrobacterales bacterium]